MLFSADYLLFPKGAFTKTRPVFGPTWTVSFRSFPYNRCWDIDTPVGPWSSCSWVWEPRSSWSIVRFWVLSLNNASQDFISILQPLYAKGRSRVPAFGGLYLECPTASDVRQSCFLLIFQFCNCLCESVGTDRDSAFCLILSLKMIWCF